jgi:ATP-dependent DNA helicase RecG
MFADRLEVYSPGRLPGHVTLENIVEERFSRNPLIVQMLVDLGFIESLGYGIDRMIQQMEDAGLPRPVFEETVNGFKVTLRGQGESLISEGAHPSRWAHLNLNERQQAALVYLTEHDRITNRAYQELCPDVSPETIRRDLVELVSRGLLLKIGDKKATYYIFK